MKRLIISCDDLGITKEINLAIRDCAENGVISSSSIVANGEFYEHALNDIINKIPISFFGLHLNLTEGVAVNKDEMNVYVQAQNLLNAQNVISVYRATGNPEDDGYLTSAAAQNAIDAQNDADAFRYLYSLAVNNPSNYSLPRMFRVGISLNFK